MKKLKNKIIYLLHKLAFIFGWLIKPFEVYLYKKYGDLRIKHQPTFIVGAPRTGSTILYQAVTNQLDVLYIDNLTSIFYKNIFFGFWLSNFFYKQKAHNSFDSNLGNTFDDGLRAPSECGNYWYRWFPEDRHFVEEDELDAKQMLQIRREVTSIINYFDKPIVFKNLNAGQRMRVLKKCFPNANFIFVKRTPYFTVQSILKAKRREQLNDNEFWSIKPKNYKELSLLPGYEQVVKQVFYLERQIIIDKSLFSSKSFLEVDYMKLKDDFTSIIESCKKLIGAPDKESYLSPDIKVVERKTLSDTEISEIEKHIKKFNWKTYAKF